MFPGIFFFFALLGPPKADKCRSTFYDRDSSRGDIRDNFSLQLRATTRRQDEFSVMIKSNFFDKGNTRILAVVEDSDKNQNRNTMFFVL